MNFREVRLVAFGDDHLDEQQSPVFGHRAVAVLENREGARVVPIVDDVLHQISVRACGHAAEEVARCEFRALQDAFGFEAMPRARNDLRHVEK